MNITVPVLLAQCARALGEWPFIASAEAAHQLPWGMLLAVGSRETNLTDEIGDGGHGHGVWQLDDRSHVIPAPFPVSSQADTAAAMLAAAYRRAGSWEGAADIYNSGQPFDAGTTGHDYGSDVIARLAVIQQHLQPKGTPMKILNRPIVAVAVRPQGDGYWLAAMDGGIFAFGAAPVFTDQIPSDNLQPGHLIVDAAPSPSGNGLWLIGADGGVFTFGDAAFHGSIPGLGIGPAPTT
jgi:hypothetical protein